jgi:hypothetical protein
MLLHSENIILIPIQSVFALSSECWVLSGEATNINIKVFGWTWPGLEPTIYRTRGEHAFLKCMENITRFSPLSGFPYYNMTSLTDTTPSIRHPEMMWAAL